MKRFTMLLAATIFMAGSAYAQLGQFQSVAVVTLENTVNITALELSEQIAAVEASAGRDLSAEETRQVLTQMINQNLLQQGAERAGVSVTDNEVQQTVNQQIAQYGGRITSADFQRLVTQQTGLGWEEYLAELRSTLRINKYVQQEKSDVIANVEPPTEREMQTFLARNQQRFINPEMVRFEQIYIDTRNADGARLDEARERLDDIARQIRSGRTSFDDALDSTVDDASIQGGDFGYLLATDEQAEAILGSSFVERVFELEDDEVSGLIQSNVGVHIVHVTDKRGARLLGLDDPLLPGQNVRVRDQIQQFLQGQSQQALLEDALNQLVAELREQAEIQVFEENLDL